jgi:hypothetical protein
MAHIYSNEFFDYIDGGARTSAQRLIGVVQPWLNAHSVLDLGSGRGVWLSEWATAGISNVLGVDGDYVDQTRLAIPTSSFHATDLTKPLELGRRFDLAQSLEVGEHLPETAAKTLVNSLTKHSDRVLFSAAVIGQGGEFHINEKPLSFWQELFAERGYTAFDCVRPELKSAKDVEPWYKYNTVFYANEAGQLNLPAEVLSTKVPTGTLVSNGGSMSWRLRRAIVSFLPRNIVTKIAQKRAAILVRKAQRLNG